MRKLIVSLIVLSFVVMPASAQSARLQGMALSGGDTGDISSLDAFPQLANGLKNRVYIRDVATSTCDRGLLLMELQEYVVGIGLCTPASGYLTGVTSGMAINGVSTVLDPDKKVDLWFAGAMGAGQIGANAYWMLNSTKTESEVAIVDPASTDTASIERSCSVMGAVLGYTMEEVGPLAKLLLAAKIELPSFENKYEDPKISTDTGKGLNPVESVEKDGGSTMGFIALGVKELNDESTLRIKVAYSMRGIDTKSVIQYDDADGDISTTPYDGDGVLDSDYDINGELTSKYSSNSMVVRCALNKVVNDDELLVVAIGLSRSASTTEVSAKDYDEAEGGLIASNGVAANGIFDTGVWNVGEASNEYLPIYAELIGTKADLCLNAAGVPFSAGGAGAIATQTGVLASKVETSTMAFPAAIGVEGRVRDYLLLRAGVEKKVLEITKTTTTNDFFDFEGVKSAVSTSETTAKPSDNVDVGLGVCFEFGNFIIDGDMTAEILHNGPYLISGLGVGTMFGTIDISYPF